MRLLKSIIGKAKDTYYNKNKYYQLSDREYEYLSKYFKQIPDEVDDKFYDKLENLLRRHEPDSEILSKVRFQTRKQKVRYLVPMPSLDKIRPNESLQKFIDKSKIKSWVISDKEDGISLQLIYSKTENPQAITGGDATHGFDVSYLVPYLNIPTLKKDIVIRGELIIPKEKFKKYSDEFKNARNLAGGIVNKKGIHKAINDVSFIAYDIMYPRSIPSKHMEILEKLGFEIAWYTKVNRLSDSLLSSILKRRKTESNYTIDGIVVTSDTKFEVTSTNPDQSIAFKEEDNFLEANVIKVEWNISKHKYLKPRVKIEPVELSGVTVQYATGFNAKFIKDNKIGEGAVVKITRSGEVIPYIMEVVKPAKAQMPNIAYEWTDSGVDIFTNEDPDNIAKAKAIATFLSNGLGTKYISNKIVLKCIQSGINTRSRFMKATPKTFMQIEGIQDTMANKMYEEIQRGKHQAIIENVAATSGYFDRNIGSKRIRAILNHYDLWELAKLSSANIVKKIIAIKGFQDTTAKLFASGLKDFILWVDKQGFVWQNTKVLVNGSKLKEQTIVFTGFRDKNLETIIQQYGGKVESGINSSTTILLVKDKNSMSSKAQKAKDVGIPVFTQNEFIDKFKL